MGGVVQRLLAPGVLHPHWRVRLVIDHTATMRRDMEERVARLGLAARGLLYAVLALLALQIAVGDGGETADSQGALDAVARQPYGRVLLVVLALGFAGYAVWRLLQMVRADTWGERIAGAGRGLLYSALCATTVQQLLTSSSGGGKPEESATARLLNLPFGVVLVVAIGLGIIGYGLYHAKEVFTGEWRHELRLGALSASARRAVTVVAVAGLVARCVVFSLTGGFLVRAALEQAPNRAVGLDGSLNQLARAPYGPALLTLVALGLFAYGLWGGVRARYERIDLG